jgi:hypothetical protein
MEIVPQPGWDRAMTICVICSHNPGLVPIISNRFELFQSVLIYEASRMPGRK